ncbi:MAG: hypothetical protein AB7F89_10565 [Pirellulaceae bacterium]
MRHPIGSVLCVGSLVMAGLDLVASGLGMTAVAQAQQTVPTSTASAPNVAANRQGEPVRGGQPAAPGQPSWYPLSKEHETYLNGILKYWEYQASQVQRYRCKFTRWEYDPVVLPRHPEIAAVIGQGNIQYQSPDKGKFQIEKLWDISVHQQGEVREPIIKEGKEQYVERKEVLDEHWVCDGKSVFQFDGRNKQLIRRPLPIEMQGKQIADGPLPFLFGAKADALLERYWIHVLPPPRKGIFWLEAVPKRRTEAADFRAIHVIIDEEDFLPQGLVLFDRAGGRTTYEFRDREKNWNMLPQWVNPWKELFYAPKAPAGWKEVEEPIQEMPMGPAAPAAGTPAPPTAFRPAPRGSATR